MTSNPIREGRTGGGGGQGSITQAFVGFDFSSWELLARVLKLFGQQLVA